MAASEYIDVNKSSLRALRLASAVSAPQVPDRRHREDGQRADHAHSTQAGADSNDATTLMGSPTISAGSTGAATGAATSAAIGAAMGAAM